MKSHSHSRLEVFEGHASRLAYALVGMIKASGIDEPTAEIFEAVTEANKALAEYQKDNRSFP